MMAKTMVEILKELRTANPTMSKYALLDKAREIFKEQKDASSS